MLPRRGSVRHISCQEARWNNRLGAVYLIQPHRVRKNGFLFSTLGFKINFYYKKIICVASFPFCTKGCTMCSRDRRASSFSICMMVVLDPGCGFAALCCTETPQESLQRKGTNICVGLEYRNATVFSGHEIWQTHLFPRIRWELRNMKEDRENWWRLRIERAMDAEAMW